MKKAWYGCMLILLAIALSGCSIDMSQAATPGFATVTLPPMPTDAGATRAWAGLGLRGRLIYISARLDMDTMDIRQLDLANGLKTVLFHTPAGGVIHSVTVSPDASQLIFSYAPPPGADQNTRQELYQMPLDGSKQPVLFLTPPTPNDQYLQPEWSPDGKFIYFVHADYQRPPQTGQRYPLFEIYRVAYPAGVPEKLVDGAYWPRLSPDMSRLAYITLDIITGKNKLFLANLDGTNALEVSLTAGKDTPLDILDAPLFAPDDRSLLFSVPVPERTYQPASPTWIEKLLGITVASAHVVPSEWWSVPLTGGAATQLTQIQAVGLFGSVSPDKDTIASYSGDGIFVMNPDGSGLTMIVKDIGGLPGTVNWVP